jgi:hypothetical protein
MARQIAGLCFLQGTFDDLTFYKMEGRYYVRVKSSLTGKRVKTSPEFKWTMIYARLLARASKIGAHIYKALPPGWRQFWMYRSFTGEAFTLLKQNPYTDEQVKQLLWQTYVQYWEQRKAQDPDNPIWQPKPLKTRKRRKYSLETIIRRKEQDGTSLWIHLEEAERKRLALEKKTMEAAKQLKKQQAQSFKPYIRPAKLQAFSTYYPSIPNRPSESAGFDTLYVPSDSNPLTKNQQSQITNDRILVDSG